MGFGPYIGPCKSTPNFIVQGACSDQRSPSELKKIRSGDMPGHAKSKGRRMKRETFSAFCARKRMVEQGNEAMPDKYVTDDQEKTATSDSGTTTDQSSSQTPPGDVTANQPVWHAKKKDILQFWRTLPGVADQKPIPIKATPIPYNYEGSTYNQDGVRITGSAEFINTVLPKVKDFLGYENPNSKLSLIYRETTPEGQRSSGDRSFAFYIKVKERGPSVKGKPLWPKAK